MTKMRREKKKITCINADNSSIPKGMKNEKDLCTGIHFRALLR